MTHVKINTTGVREESPVARGLIVASMVQIEHTSVLNMKEVISNSVCKPGG
jgi:hypothetical protein